MTSQRQVFEGRHMLEHSLTLHVYFIMCHFLVLEELPEGKPYFDSSRFTSDKGSLSGSWQWNYAWRPA